MRPHVFDNPDSRYLVLRPRRQEAAPAASHAEGADGRWRMPLPLDADEMAASELRQCIQRGEALAFAPSVPVQLISQLPEEVKLSPAPEAPPTDLAGASIAGWGIEAVGAHTSTFDGTGVTVAILDNGIRCDHAAFAGVPLQCQDFTGTGIRDSDGHGTHAASILFGQDIEGRRIGVARRVTSALVGKVVEGGHGTLVTLAQGLLWAINSNAHVISMSLGVNFIAFRRRLIEEDNELPDVATSKTLVAYEQTIHLFDRIASLAKGFAPFSRPCLLIAAVGNGSNHFGTGTFALGAEAPAMCEDFIGVGAIDPPDVKGRLTVSDFSNSGPAVCAPGAGIVGAGVPGGLNTLSLTSTAAPHAAGVAALWVQKLLQQKRLTTRELNARFLGSADISRFDPAVSPQDAIGLGLVQAPQR